jgi:hypothetical protein
MRLLRPMRIERYSPVGRSRLTRPIITSLQRFILEALIPGRPQCVVFGNLKKLGAEFIACFSSSCQTMPGAKAGLAAGERPSLSYSGNSPADR